MIITIPKLLAALGAVGAVLAFILLARRAAFRQLDRKRGDHKPEVAR